MDAAGHSSLTLCASDIRFLPKEKQTGLGDD